MATDVALGPRITYQQAKAVLKVSAVEAAHGFCGGFLDESDFDRTNGPGAWKALQEKFLADYKAALDRALTSPPFDSVVAPPVVDSLPALRRECAELLIDLRWVASWQESDARLMGEREKDVFGGGLYAADRLLDAVRDLLLALPNVPAHPKPTITTDGVSIRGAIDQLAGVNAWCDAGSEATKANGHDKAKGSGRPKANYETVNREADLAAEWQRQRDAKVYKADFAKDKGMKLADLDLLLDRVAARNRRSDK